MQAVSGTSSASEIAQLRTLAALLPNPAVMVTSLHPPAFIGPLDEQCRVLLNGTHVSTVPPEEGRSHFAAFKMQHVHIPRNFGAGFNALIVK